VNGAYIRDETGAETLVDPSTYWVSTHVMPGRIAQKIDASWPDTAGRAFECFRVNYTAGYLTPFTVTDGSATISAPGHNYAVGQIVPITNRDGALPQPFVNHQSYYVVASTPSAGTLQLSATSGGTAIIPTTTGSGNQFLGELPDAIRRSILIAAGEDRFGNTRGEKRGEQKGSLPPYGEDLWKSEKIWNL
jgi:hypothetical protein